MGCITFLVSLRCGGGDDISAKALLYLKQPGSSVRIATDQAMLHMTPSEGGASIWTAARMDVIPVDSERLYELPLGGWIPVKGTGGKRSSKVKAALPDAWVRRRDVVIAGDYKKVTGCWPIRSVTYVGGDYAVDVTFALDGSASVKEWADQDEMINQLPLSAHVYIAKNIVVVESTANYGKAFFTSAYNPADRMLYPENAKPEKIELFPVEALAGCSAVPIIEK